MLRVAVLARCPSCEEVFPVVGRGLTLCPFCAVVMEIEIVRHSAGAREIRTRRAMNDDVAARRLARVTGGSAVERSTADRAGRRAAMEVEVSPDAIARSAAEVFAEAREGARLLARLRADRVSMVAWEGPGFWPIRWLRTLFQIFRRPRRFFERLSADRWGGAVSFATLQLMMAVAAVVVARTPFNAASFLGPFVLLLAATTVAAALFFVLLVACFHGASEAAMRRRVRWAGVGRVAAFGLAPLVFVWIPFGGWPAAMVGAAALHAIGLRQVLDLPWTTSALTAAVPWMSALSVLALASR